MTQRETRKLWSLAHKDDSDKMVLYDPETETVIRARVELKQRVYTVAEVIAHLATNGATDGPVTSVTAANWLRKRDLVGLRVPGRGQGGQWRVTAASLTNFARKLKTRATAAPTNIKQKGKRVA